MEETLAPEKPVGQVRRYLEAKIMRNKLSALSFVIVLMLLSGPVAANGSGKEKREFLVSADWLKNKIGKNLVLLHVGNKEEFDKEHIPGAQYISTRDVSTTREENSLTLELPPPERLKTVFENFGISNDSKIVIYWGKDWVTPSTRIFFTLETMGLSKNAYILDGGMPAWIKAGNPVTDKLAEVKPGSIKLRTRNLVATQSELVDAILNNKPIAIIDARDPKYYTGADKGSMPRAGHIPNAQNIPYSTFVTEDNFFKNKADLQELFDGAGVEKDVPVVTYCHIGQQASLAYFVARMLGYEVRIYDGSFQEWSNSEEKVVVEEPN